MMNKSEFHLLNYDPVELDNQIAIRKKLHSEMVGQFYRGIVYEELLMLLEIKDCQ